MRLPQSSRWLLASLSLLLAESANAQTGPGFAFSFDGAAQFVSVPNPKVPAGDSPYTIEAWIKPNRMGARGIVGWGNYGVDGQVNALRLTDNGLVNYWWANDLSVTTSSLVGQWHHVAATYDGKTRAIYLDGNLVASAPAGSHNAASTTLTIGKTQDTEYFDGLIDEVRIWTVARNQRQIRATMRGLVSDSDANLAAYWPLRDSVPSAKDSTLHSNDGVLINSASWFYFVPPPNGPGFTLILDPRLSYPHIDVPDAIWFSGDLTVEAWVNVRSYNSWSRLLDFGNGAGDNNVLVALSDGITGRPHFHVVANTTIGPGITAPDPLPLNQWSHLACVLNGTTGTIYVNGQAVISGPMNRPVSVVRTNCFIGRSNWPFDREANAIIDEVRIWTVARSASQIQANMRRQLFSNATGLIAYYRLDESGGLDVFDASGHGHTGALINTAGYSPWQGSNLGEFSPTVRTLEARAVAGGPGVTFNGLVERTGSPNGATAYVAWGLSPSLGNQTPHIDVSPNTQISFTAQDLRANTTYYFRAVASNEHGTSYGATLTLSFGATNFVSNNHNAGPGSLRQVVQDSVPWDTILFAPDITRPIQLTSGQILLDKDLWIDASAQSNGITILGNHASRIFAIDFGRNVTLRSLRLEGGAANFGGAIQSFEAHLTLDQCAIRGCSATNSAQGGGSGGGIAAFRGELYVIKSTLSGNGAAFEGGGILSDGRLEIVNSTVSGNSAAFRGGGICSEEGNIINSTFAQNATGGSGSAIKMIDFGFSNSGFKIVNSTIVGNVGGNGESITGDTLQGSIPLILENSIVAGNSGGDIAGDISVTQIGANLIGGNPGLAPLNFYGGLTQTMAPLPGSPALDRAINTPSTPATDQRGGLRVVDLPTIADGAGRTGLDIGAVEVGGFLRVTEIVPNQTQVDVSFTSEPLWSLHLESKDALRPGPWTLVPASTRVGNGTVLTVPDTRPKVPKRFYRAVMTP